MKKAMLTLVFGSAIFLAACGGGEEAKKPEETTSTPETTETAADPGQVAVERSCISCHGNELQGGAGPALNNVGSRLSEQEILDIINNGTPNGMPKGLITGADAEAAAKWLATQK